MTISVAHPRMREEAMKHFSLPAGVLLSLLLLPSLGAQEPQSNPQAGSQTPSFPAQVEIVTVDTVVTDKQGSPITGLTRDDFTVLEDGVPQKVESFEAVQLPPAPAAVPAPRPRVSVNTSPGNATARTFVVIFDDVHLTRGQGQRAKAAVAEFLKSGVREGDRVTLVSTGGDAWWTERMEAGREELMSILKRMDGRFIPDISPERMSDYEAMRIHVYGDSQVEQTVQRRFESYGASQPNPSQGQPNTPDNIGDPRVRGRASEVYYQAVSKNRLTLEILERVLDALAPTRGRKSVILVSEGFIYDPNLSEFKRVVQSSRRSNCAVYFLDTRGLQGLPVYFSAEFGPPMDERDIGSAMMDPQLASEGAESLADDTGGFSVKNTNDLNKGIKRIADESQSYYLLGYHSTNTKADGRFRKIEVKVNHKGVQVRARKGYFAPLEGGQTLAKDKDKNKKNVDPAFQEALDAPFDVDSIPLRMSAYVFDETLLGKARVMVATEADVSGFSFEEKEGRALDTLEFLLVTAHRETGEYFRYDQKVEMKLLPATREKLQKTWLPIVREFELAPGGYQAKIVVRDAKSGRVGTVTHEFDVPDQAAFRTSTPVLSDTLQPAAEGEKAAKPQVAMVVRRNFTSGEMIYCSFEVYGAAKDKASGMPKVSSGYAVRKPDGAVLLGTNPTVITPTSLGKLSRMVGARLVDATPGDYEMLIYVKDEVTGKTLEVKEPFTVTGPAVASGR
jgi:VWFA-related protein